MLDKLIKYEFKSSYRLMSIIWGVLILISIVERAAVKSAATGLIGKILSTIGGISTMLYFALFAAVYVVTIVLIVMRFYKGLLGAEGYLMHSLPVSKHSLIAAKAIVALVTVCISALMAIVSILIITDANIVALFKSISDLNLSASKVILGIEVIVLILLYTMFEIYKVYLAMAIGQTANKHRELFSFLAYIAIHIAILAVIAVSAHINFNFDIGLPFNGLKAVNLLMLALIIIGALIILAFHFATEKILEKKLNLQ